MCYLSNGQREGTITLDGDTQAFTYTDGLSEGSNNLRINCSSCDENDGVVLIDNVVLIALLTYELI